LRHASRFGARIAAYHTAPADNRALAGGPFPAIRGIVLNFSLRAALLAGLVVVASGLTVTVPVTAAPARTRATVAPWSPLRAPAEAPVDRFIVRFRDDALEKRNPVARQRLLDGVSRKLGVKVTHGRGLANGADLLRTDRKLGKVDAKRLVIALRSDPRIEYVEVDRLHQPQALPGDPLLINQPQYLQALGGHGFDTAWNRGTGAGVVVAVVDTGITAHPDLAPNVLPGYDFISDLFTANDGDGRDGDASDPGDWTDAGICSVSAPARISSFHGTQVAGVLAAAANNGIGIAGAAYDAKILPVRALGRCGGYTSDIADAIVWAVGGTVAGAPANPNPAEVVNLSFATEGACDATTQAAIDVANAAGAVVVASAGNGGTGPGTGNPANMSPSGCDGVIVVAMGSHWTVGSPTGGGSAVDLLASGGDMPFLATGLPPFVATLTTTHDSGTTVPVAPVYAQGRGTSLSTALVSGAVALMQSIAPQSPPAVEALLKATGETQDGQSGPVRLLDPDAATYAVGTPSLVARDRLFVVETDGSVTLPVTVTLTRPVTVPVTFTAATADGTALAGEDYVAMPPTPFTIAPGQTTASFELTVLGDDVGEVAEGFEVRITDVAGAADLTRALPVDLRDDDAQLVTNQGAGWYNGGNGASQLFAFTLPAHARNLHVYLEGVSNPADPDLYVRAATAPTVSDYDCASATVGDDESCALGDVSGVYFALVTNIAPNELGLLHAEWDAMPALRIDDARTVEGNTGDTRKLGFLVSRPHYEAAYPSSFTVTFTGGTATAGDDFVAATSNQNFVAGEFEKYVNVTLTGDTQLESNETVVATLSNVTWGTIDRGTATGVIANDDGPTLSVGDTVAPEGQSGTGAAQVTVSLSEPVASDVTFDYATADGTAAAGSDYVATGGSRVIPAGALTATFPVSVNGDTTSEGDEALYVDVSNGSVSVLRDRATLRIANDDAGITIGDVTVLEGQAGEKVATFVVQIPVAVPVPVTMEARTQAGTATSGQDFLPQWQVLTIPAGMTSKTFSVAILGDTAVEANETFTVKLSKATNAAIQDGTAVGTITNDETPAISVADVTVVEGDGGTKQMTFTATLSNPTSNLVTFGAVSGDNTATAPSDYVPLDAGGFTIPVGQLARTFAVTIKGDTLVEPTEYLRVDLKNVVGATIADGRAVGYITNNDGARISINNVALAEGNSGQKAMTFTVSLSQAAPGPVTYNIASTNGTAVAGSDFAALNLTGQVIPAGELTKTHTVLVNGDTALEDTEAFSLFVRQPTGASVWDGQGVGYILNDDSPALSVADVGTSEGNAGTKVLNVTVRLSQAATVPVSYTLTTSSGTAVDGSDFVAASLADQVIPAGQLTKVHQVVVNGDTDVEANESFNVTLSNPVGATLLDAQGLGFIYNDDGPTLTVGNAAISEGNAGTKLLTFTVNLSVAQGSPVTYNIATSNLTATAGSDYVASSLVDESIPAGQLSKTFAVTLNGDTTVEANETFRVTLSNPTAGVSLLRPVATGTINNDD